MGDARVIFSWAVSVFNFLILAFLFQKIVIFPMVEAVRVRAAKVTARLKEIGQLLAEARQTEAVYQEQFAKLASEEADLRATNQREVERVTARIRSGGEADAKHVVEKARREGEKMRVEALGEMQHQMVVLALARVEGLLKENLDVAGHDDLNQQVLGKVEAIHAA